LIIIGDRTSEQCYQAVQKIIKVYNRAGFTIRTIHGDGEFEPLHDMLDGNITLALTAADEHQPEAERNNQTIKEVF